MIQQIVVPDVSIIVCSFNRAQSLALTLDSIAEAIRNSPGWKTEVVLVDNGSTDDTQHVIKQWLGAVPFPVKALMETRKGVACARNTGIKASTGRIVVFTDDDCRMNPDYLVVLRRHYTKDSEPVMRGGCVELGDSSDIPFTIKLDKEIERMNDVHHPGAFLLGCNMVMKREILDNVGYFDERFGAGAVFKAAEDTDFTHRAYRAGFAVEYVPDMIVKHFHGRNTRESILSLNRGYNFGNGALYAKHCFDWRLLRHFYWDFRKLVYEAFGGESFKPDIGLSYRHTVLGNIKGAALYFIEHVKKGNFGFGYGKCPDHEFATGENP